MRIRSYLFLLVCGLCTCTQSFAQVAKPVRYPGDPMVIFRQTFEPKDQTISADSAWKEWCNTPVDTIREIAYYSKIGTSTVSKVDIYDGSEDWNIFAVRTDSIIPMLNGVELYADDYSTIVSDGDDISRVAAFDKYGEDGGEYFFKYTTTANGGSSKNTAKYRRNLFVRGFDIEDETSYRLTLYVKAKKLAGNSPLFYADVMRGYHHQREAFSMGITSGTAYEYEKSGLTNEWQKITFMTYYLNDSVADGYTFYNGYSWADDWTWRPTDDQLAAWNKTLNPGEYLNYVKQPDKYFVRLAFATDSVEYSIDNLSLTKSWIGGVEHEGNMIRVDFGYETNLKALAQAAYAETGIAAMELPGEYFSVYGYMSKRDEWVNIEIESAEYHDDGYMYMWSKDTYYDGRYYMNPFSVYDSVLVSFTNPVDDDKLCLKYTGKTYPMPLDTVWVNAGKKVHDFTNELSTPNPYIAKDKNGNKITPVTQLPPVMVSYPYENGSFGLNSINEITVGMSRLILYDDKGELSEYAFLRVTKAGFKEIWKVKDATATTATFARSESDITTNGDLVGDYTFEFLNLKASGTDYGKNVTLNYHFGDFSTTVNESVPYFISDWLSEITKGELKGANPTSTYVHDADTEFKKGDGTKAGSAKIRLYALDYDAMDMDNCGYYLVTKSNQEGPTGNIYTIINFTKAGGYSIKFKAAAWDRVGYPAELYFYPKPNSDLEDGDDKGFAVLEKLEKTLLGAIDPQVKVAKKSVKDVNTGKWPDDVETFEYTFLVPSAGDYMFEWRITAGDDYGVFIGNFFISSMGEANLSTPYVKKLCDAVAAATDMLDAAVADEYQGDAYNALSTVIEEGNAYKGNYPSKYDSVVAHVNDCMAQMSERISVVDLFYSTEDDVDAKLSEFEHDTLGMVNLAAYIALSNMFDGNFDFECPENTNDEINAAIQAYKDAMAALDARLELMDKYAEKLETAKELTVAKDAHRDYPEFGELENVYGESSRFDQIGTADDEYQAQYDRLCESINTYVFKVDAVDAYTRQAKELFALADTLGYDFGGDKAGVKDKVYSLLAKDDDLETILRTAAILEILKIYQEADEDDLKLLDNLDVSALMPNYYLYNEALVDRDMEQNSSGKWRIKRGTNTTAFPDWTLTYSSGTWYPTKSRIDVTNIDWEAEGHVFAGGVRCGSSSKGTLSTQIAELPHALYWVGAYVHNNTSNVTFAAKSDSADVTITLSKLNGYKEVGIDSVMVDDSLKVTAAQTSGSSSSEVDFRYFVLRLRGADAAYDYAKAVSDQKAKLAGLITFADASDEETDVQYFSLGGIQITAPKAGEVVIRRITLSDGTVVAEKILVK